MTESGQSSPQLPSDDSTQWTETEVPLTQFGDYLAALDPRRQQGPTLASPERRVSVAGSLTNTVASHPTAAVQHASDAIKTLQQLMGASDAAPGELRRVRQALVEVVETAAGQNTASVYGETGALIDLLSAESVSVRLTAGETLATVAETDATILDRPAEAVRACLSAPELRLSTLGAKLLSRTASEIGESAREFVPDLVDYAGDPDHTLRREVINALHEVSIVTPDAVVPHLDDLASRLDDEDGRVRALAVLLFVEALEADPDAAWEHVDSIVGVLGKPRDRRNLRVGAFFRRTALVDPEKLATEVETVANVTGRAFDRIDSRLATTIRRVACDYPRAGTTLLNPGVRAATTDGASPEARADVLVALSWITAETNCRPSFEWGRELLKLTATAPDIVRSAAAALLERAVAVGGDYRRALGDTVCRHYGKLHPDSDPGDPPRTTPVETLVSAVRVDVDETADLSRPDWGAVLRQDTGYGKRPELADALRNLKRRLSGDDQLYRSDIERVAEFLDADAISIRRSVLKFIAVVSSRRPELLIQYVPRVVSACTDDDLETRKQALAILWRLTKFDASAVPPDFEQLAASLSKGADQRTKRLLGLLFQELSISQCRRPSKLVSQILDATAEPVEREDVAILTTVYDLVIKHPDAGLENFATIADTLRTGRGGDRPDERSLSTDHFSPDLDGLRDHSLDSQFHVSDTLLPTLSEITSAYPGVVSVYREAVARLLTSPSETVRYTGHHLLQLSAKEEPIISKFGEQIVAAVDPSESEEVASTAANTLRKAAKSDPKAAAEYASTIRDKTTEFEASGGGDEVLKHLTATLTAVVSDVPVDTLPSLSLLLKLIRRDGPETPAALRLTADVEYFETAVAGDPASVDKIRRVVKQWCGPERDPEAVADAVTVLSRVGSTSTLDVEVSL